MRIAIIIIIGILAYLVVFIPGYFYIIPNETDKLPDNKTSLQLHLDSSTGESSEQPIANPGDAPPSK